MARERVNISVQKKELEIIDRRAKELGMTRSAYLRTLVLRDIARDSAVKNKRRISDFIKD